MGLDSASTLDPLPPHNFATGHLSEAVEKLFALGENTVVGTAATHARRRARNKAEAALHKGSHQFPLLAQRLRTLNGNAVCWWDHINGISKKNQANAKFFSH